jgi:type II secretory pathway pseudopilin PulG
VIAGSRRADRRDDAGPDPETGDRGETLIEILVAVMIMGIAVVVLIGGVGTAVRMSGIHRQQAKADAYVRAFAEALETAVANSPSTYADCATTTTYGSVYTPPDATYTASVTAVAYWSAGAFGSTCVVGADTGVQRVTLRVRSSDGMGDESIDLIIRKPCRSTADFPLDAPCV